jgi:hypothetical protein
MLRLSILCALLLGCCLAWRWWGRSGWWRLVPLKHHQLGSPYGMKYCPHCQNASARDGLRSRRDT